MKNRGNFILCRALPGSYLISYSSSGLVAKKKAAPPFRSSPLPDLTLKAHSYHVPAGTFFFPSYFRRPAASGRHPTARSSQAGARGCTDELVSPLTNSPLTSRMRITCRIRRWQPGTALVVSAAQGPSHPMDVVAKRVALAPSTNYERRLLEDAFDR